MLFLLLVKKIPQLEFGTSQKLWEKIGTHFKKKTAPGMTQG